MATTSNIRGLGQKRQSWDYGLLVGLWLVAAVVDRLWFHLDQAPPAWDQGDHLSRAMHYWRVLQHPQVQSEAWWTELWQLSPTYRAPLVYILTAPFFALFGGGYDQATLVNLVFTAVLIGAIYGLGRQLFSPQTGLWAVAVCLLSQTLAATRTDYLLDYGLTATLTAALTGLTFWRWHPNHSWSWTIVSGLLLGLVVLNRPTGLLFLVVPLLWLAGEVLVRRQWVRLVQLVIMAGLTIAVPFPWFSTNWLTILSSIAQANAGGVVYENDPQANTLAGWLYYARKLPGMMSPPLVLVGVGCAAIGLGRWLWRKHPQPTVASQGTGSLQFGVFTRSEWQAWLWLLSFVLGIYALCSLAANKDPRFIQPYLPVVGLLIGRSLTLGVGHWWTVLRWGTGLAAALWLLADLFPIPGVASGQHRPYMGSPYPHEQVIAEVVRQQPYLRSTIGLVANTAQINPMNVDFYGAVATFQVYGRQLAFSDRTALQDSRALDWYLTKTGDQGAYNGIEAGQKALKTLVETSPELSLHKTWQLPDASELRLYHRRTPPVAVTPSDRATPQLALLDIQIPTKISPSQPAPVRYTWSGNWATLRDGIVLVDWVPTEPAPNSQSPTAATLPQKVTTISPSKWIHDHGIGLGQLYAGASPPLDTALLQVVEQMATQPPAGLASGQYALGVRYLNRRTGETYTVDAPALVVTVDPQADPPMAPELDLPSQFRTLGALLSQGKLDPVFNEIGRINQYDPIQDYLLQVEMALKQRLQADPDRPDLLYTLGLIYVLQRRTAPAIATFTHLSQVDSQNPWAWVYLGLTHLYCFHPQRATNALAQADRLQPGIPEVHTLKVIAAAMRLDFLDVAQLLKAD
jgi:4-amino-4-deoxy-L-arabinose transferase-like glycosyltransferase